MLVFEIACTFLSSLSSKNIVSWISCLHICQWKEASQVIICESLHRFHSFVDRRWRSHMRRQVSLWVFPARGSSWNRRRSLFQKAALILLLLLLITPTHLLIAQSHSLVFYNYSASFGEHPIYCVKQSLVVMFEAQLYHVLIQPSLLKFWNVSVYFEIKRKEILELLHF